MNSSPAPTELPLLNPFATRAIRAGAIPYWDPAQQQAEIERRFEQSGYRGAIVGPHGSGKTTLLASLADRWRSRFSSIRWLTILRTPAGLQLDWHGLEREPVAARSSLPSTGIEPPSTDQTNNQFHSPPSSGESRPQDAGGEGAGLAPGRQSPRPPRTHRAADCRPGRVESDRPQFFSQPAGEATAPHELWIVDGYDALPWRDRLGLSHFCRRHRIALIATAHRPGNLPTLVRTSPTLAAFLYMADRLQGDRTDRLEHSELEACYRAAQANLREAFLLAFDKYEEARRLKAAVSTATARTKPESQTA